MDTEVYVLNLVSEILRKKISCRISLFSGADLASDSEEDEGLFGKQQRSPGLFDGLRQPSNSQGSYKSSDSITPSGIFKPF